MNTIHMLVITNPDSNTILPCASHAAAREQLFYYVKEQWGMLDEEEMPSDCDEAIEQYFASHYDKWEIYVQEVCGADDESEMAIKMGWTREDVRAILRGKGIFPSDANTDAFLDSGALDAAIEYSSDHAFGCFDEAAREAIRNGRFDHLYDATSDLIAALRDVLVEQQVHAHGDLYDAACEVHRLLDLNHAIRNIPLRRLQTLCAGVVFGAADRDLLERMIGLVDKAADFSGRLRVKGLFGTRVLILDTCGKCGRRYPVGSSKGVSWKDNADAVDLCPSCARNYEPCPKCGLRYRRDPGSDREICRFCAFVEQGSKVGESTAEVVQLNRNSDTEGVGPIVFGIQRNWLGTYVRVHFGMSINQFLVEYTWDHGDLVCRAAREAGALTIN